MFDGEVATMKLPFWEISWWGPEQDTGHDTAREALQFLKDRLGTFELKWRGDGWCGVWDVLPTRRRPEEPWIRATLFKIGEWDDG